jgi:hypothetical protein
MTDFGQIEDCIASYIVITMTTLCSKHGLYRVSSNSVLKLIKRTRAVNLSKLGPNIGPIPIPKKSPFFPIYQTKIPNSTAPQIWEGGGGQINKPRKKLLKKGLCLSFRRLYERDAIYLKHFQEQI